MPNEQFTHVIPGIGLQEFVLFPPADELYRRLRLHKEFQRQQSLRHLGSLSHVFDGARQVRWDYACAMLYYVKELSRIPGLSSSFRLGKVQFSSGVAALQCIALSWNVGHLPGTFAVEKGCLRYLASLNPQHPLDLLTWPHGTEDDSNVLHDRATQHVVAEDYRGLARSFAVFKFLSWSTGTADQLYVLTTSFLGPFLLNYDPDSSSQWAKLRRAFKIIRHLAYLTLDAPYTGIQWAPRVPTLVRQTVDSGISRLREFDDAVSEALSPLEMATYRTLYHAPKARAFIAATAQRTFERLGRVPDSAATLTKWLDSGLYRHLGLGSVPALHQVGATILRSHFVGLPSPPRIVEDQLRSNGFSHPTVLQYKAWNSETLLEPDETIVDVLSRTPPTSLQIGKLLLWNISSFDTLTTRPDNPIQLAQKTALSTVYEQYLGIAVRARFAPLQLEIEPWPLHQFGLFQNMGIQDSASSVWACDSALDDHFCKYLLRNRAKSLPGILQPAYAELQGLAALRRYLRQSWSHRKELRQRWLLMTASVRLVDAMRSVIEFDGAMLRISTRSGRLTFYGLEAKTGRANPATALRRRLKPLAIRASIHKLSNTHAAAEILL